MPILHFDTKLTERIQEMQARGVMQTAGQLWEGAAAMIRAVVVSQESSGRRMNKFEAMYHHQHMYKRCIISNQQITARSKWSQ